MNTFNVCDFGATGQKSDSAQSAIQETIDACCAAGGGMVYFPPGAYTTGTLHLKTHVRIFVEAGATVYSSKNAGDYSVKALFYGEDIQNITLEGRGIIDGQAEYDWRLSDHDDRYILDNQRQMEALGKPLMRAFPTENSIGNLVHLIRCKDVVIRDLSFIDSPSWTIHPYACERLTIEGVYVRTSREAGVWADGIDPDGCKDVRIANCTIETGDDALVFYSSDIYGPALPCENITVTNCRLSSASSALKFCDGIKNCVRNVTIDNCIITDSNRGIAFMEFDGGYVSDIVISNMVINCRRYDWFWWGNGDPLHFLVKQRSEMHPEMEGADEPSAGTIRNVLLKNIIARGAGPCEIAGHPDSSLDGITMENIKLTLFDDPEAPFNRGGDALTFKHARNLRLSNIEVVWDNIVTDGWKSAFCFEDIEGLVGNDLQGVAADEGPPIRFERTESISGNVEQT
ncbi:MAG: hypothetical protein HOH43_16920 [Candidatus Latescibacteria bacterium]|jgi:hypothetical protein|nr:hypothetical protein [Candidatus Latescibacterota bacterium]